MPYTRADLLAAGIEPNARMWIGDGFLFCRTCHLYTYHHAWSRRGRPQCYEVCRNCGTYSGPARIHEEATR